MCPLFFEAASSTPICCITNTTKPIFIIEKDYSSLSTQEETRQLLLKSLCTIIMGLFLEERNSLSTEERFHANNVRPNSSSPSTQHNMYILKQIQQRLSIFFVTQSCHHLWDLQKRKISITFALFSWCFSFRVEQLWLCCCFFPPSWHLGVITIIVLFSLSLSLSFFVS